MLDFRRSARSAEQRVLGCLFPMVMGEGRPASFDLELEPQITKELSVILSGVITFFCVSKQSLTKRYRERHWDLMLTTQQPWPLARQMK